MSLDSPLDANIRPRPVCPSVEQCLCAPLLEDIADDDAPCRRNAEFLPMLRPHFRALAVLELETCQARLQVRNVATQSAN